MKKTIAVVPGDFIGPEVVAETILVMKSIANKFNHEFEFIEACAGGAAIDKFGEPLPKASIDICKASDSVLLGAVGGAAGGNKWDEMPPNKRPEQALLGLRKELGLFANLRPALLHKQLIDACPLKPEISQGGIDIMVVRELTGGIYFGEKGRKNHPGASRHPSEGGELPNEIAYDIEQYSTEEVRRIAVTAFDIAMKRSKRVTSVDKANVLESSRLWREVVIEVSKNYPEVTLDHMYVDNASMQLIRDPQHFDVLLTSNMFGDILSDEASQLTGSIGMLPSASLNETGLGMYEPIHGSAPDIAGQDKANPIATILSAAMMLKYSFGMMEEAAAIEAAVSSVLELGCRTGDIMSAGCKQVGTQEMGMLIRREL